MTAAFSMPRVIVVAPTEHLKTQWADAAGRVGIHLDPRFSNTTAVTSSDYDGVAVTYAQVASRPSVHEQRTREQRTLVILDEIHHGGDNKSWGDGIREAFEPAVRRLSLTGTPFRSDTNPIPFVGYEYGDDGILRSSSDYTYGYAEALRDGVVRPVLFMAYGGAMRWRTRAGDEVAARLGEPMTKDLVAQAWRTALDHRGDWMPQVLRAADARLSRLREHGMTDAGGLVIASDQQTARAYAKLLETITGEKSVVVLSDDSGSSERIATFALSEQRWMVAVRMVSEGVDIPRLAVGVYATSASTPLYFAQAIGRFVRARRRGVHPGALPQHRRLHHPPRRRDAQSSRQARHAALQQGHHQGCQAGRADVRPRPGRRRPGRGRLRRGRRHPEGPGRRALPHGGGVHPLGRRRRPEDLRLQLQGDDGVDPARPEHRE